MLEPQSIRHRRHPVRIAPKDLDALARLSGGVPLAEEVLGRGPRRSGSAREELNVHLESGGIRGRPDGFITACNSSQLGMICPVS